METEIGKETINIDDDISITNDGARIKIESTEKSIIINCRNENIEIMNKEGYSNFGDLYINGKKIEDKLKKLRVLNELMSKLKTTEIFHVEKIDKIYGDLQVTCRMHDDDIDYPDSSYDKGFYHKDYWPFYDDDDFMEVKTTLVSDDKGNYIKDDKGNYISILKTEWGSEYIEFNDKKAQVYNKEYIQKKDKGLRKAVKSDGNSKFYAPMGKGFYKLVFSNFDNVTSANFVVDGGEYTSEVFSNTYIVEKIFITNYIEININSVTKLIEGNQGSTVEDEGTLACTMSLVI